MLKLKLLLILMLLVAVHAKGPDLTPTDRNSSRKCLTKAGKDGLCVNESYCNEDHVILPGGVIDDSELRSSSCSGGMWCCSEELIIETTILIPKSSHRCYAQKGDYCPWCVSLYRASEKIIKDTGLFCAGVLIGSKVVLTTATCNAVSLAQTVWARVPDSAQPDRNYKVLNRKPHESYNSGTRENDFALLILESEVNWNGGGKTACLDLSTPLMDACFSFGYDSKDQFVSTLLAVTKGSCIKGVSTEGVHCGRPIDDDPCIVATGAPVICPGASKELIVTGVAQAPCRGLSVQLGTISSSSQWIRSQLSQLGLSESSYTYVN